MCMLYLMRLTQECRKLKKVKTKSPSSKLWKILHIYVPKFILKSTAAEGKSTSLADRSNIPREWRHNTNSPENFIFDKHEG